MRWICRNIEGTRREIVFNGSGLGVLWRDDRGRDRLSCFIIPIPWVYRWYHALVRVADSRWCATRALERVEA